MNKLTVRKWYAGEWFSRVFDRAEDAWKFWADSVAAGQYVLTPARL